MAGIGLALSSCLHPNLKNILTSIPDALLPPGLFHPVLKDDELAEGQAQAIEVAS